MLAVDVLAVAIGFGVVYLLDPFFSGDIAWLYLLGAIVGLVVWVVGHLLVAYRDDKRV